MTTDKVQLGDTTGTTSGTSYTWRSPNHTAERGWECPRCGRINAPWKSQCDCSGYHWTIGDRPYEDWWTKITCNPDTFRIHPESDPIYNSGTPYTIHKAPSSVCHADSNTAKPADYENVTAWSNCSTTVDSPDNPWNQFKTPTAGGSDYWNPVTKTWENVSKNITNSLSSMRQELDELKSTFGNTLRGE